ncbi:MAG TPA: murein biosynthesis integral membrane protein MurJ [Aggregatilineaceae bacterium]|nr:murein biosynthesis integral membrane protein MurJ [Aggregatilineaceae bacterium]
MPNDSGESIISSNGTTPDGIGGAFKPSLWIALGNLLSRLLSFAGDAVKSHYFGAGGVVDAFNVAAAVPTLLSDLVIKSLVDSAAIPVFSECSKEDLWPLATALLNLTGIVVTGAVVLMEGFAPRLVSLISGGSPPDVQALTVNLLHLTLPVLLILNFSGILSALLYVRRRIILPTVAGTVFNGVIVVVAVSLQARLGIFALALGLLLGALVQTAVQLAGLRGLPWRYHLLFWHPGVRQIAILYFPILVGLLAEVFLSRPVTYALASRTGEGGISWMTYALTLRQLPEGLIATALSVTVLVRLSAEKNPQAFRSTLVYGLRLAMLLILPAGVGLLLLARPVTALLFEHGSFTASDTRITAFALQWYVGGLPFSTIDLLLVVAFYARHNTWTPAAIGLCCTLLYMALAALLLPRFGLNSIMFADSVRYVVHMLLCALILFPALGGLADPGAFRTLLHTLIASAIMGLTVGVVSQALVPGESLIPRLMDVGISILSGLVVYGGVLAVLSTDDLRLILSLVRGNRR